MRNGGAIGARPDPRPDAKAEPKARPLPKAKVALAPRPRRSRGIKRKATLMAGAEETPTISEDKDKEEIVPFQQEEAKDASEDKDKAEIVPFEDDEASVVMQNVRDVFDDLLNC